MRPIAISFTTRAPTAASSLDAAQFSASATDSAVLTKAQLVIREIELERTDNACDVDDGDEGDRNRNEPSGQNNDRDDDEDCEEIELDPVLVDLPLNNQVQTQFETALPDGEFHEIEIRIDKPEDDSIGRAFIARNPAFKDISVLAEGTFQGKPFRFQARVEAKLEFEFEPALAIGPSGANITVRVLVGRWFRAADGAPIDPATASPGGPNEGRVIRNIVLSIQAFADGNRDGVER